MFTYTDRKDGLARPRRRARMSVAAVVGAVALSAASASPAFALSEQFMSNQGLSAGNAKASVAAHSGSSVLVYGNSDHSWCPSLARGYAGYTSSPNSGGNTTVYQGAACGPGYQSASWNTNGYQWHGAAWNRNVSTFDNFTYATVIW